MARLIYIARAVALASLITPLLAVNLPNPLICEDSLDGKPPFNASLTPCILGCPAPITNPVDIGNHGTYNASDLAPCLLGCVIKNPSSAEQAAASGCVDKCKKLNSGAPEQQGWCMYYCVQGGELASQVVSTSCVPQYEMATFSPPVTTTLEGTQALTLSVGITMPSQWVAWYETQTIMSKTANIVTGSPSGSSSSQSSAAFSMSPTSMSSTSGGTTPAPTAPSDSAASSSQSAPVSTSTRSAASSAKIRSVSSRWIGSLIVLVAFVQALLAI